MNYAEIADDIAATIYRMREAGTPPSVVWVSEEDLEAICMFEDFMEGRNHYADHLTTQRRPSRFCEAEVRLRGLRSI